MTLSFIHTITNLQLLIEITLSFIRSIDKFQWWCEQWQWKWARDPSINTGGKSLAKTHGLSCALHVCQHRTVNKTYEAHFQIHWTHCIIKHQWLIPVYWQLTLKYPQIYLVTSKSEVEVGFGEMIKWKLTCSCYFKCFLMTRCPGTDTSKLLWCYEALSGTLAWPKLPNMVLFQPWLKPHFHCCAEKQLFMTVHKTFYLKISFQMTYFGLSTKYITGLIIQWLRICWSPWVIVQFHVALHIKLHINQTYTCAQQRKWMLTGCAGELSLMTKKPCFFHIPSHSNWPHYSATL